MPLNLQLKVNRKLTTSHFSNMGLCSFSAHKSSHGFTGLWRQRYGMLAWVFNGVATNQSSCFIHHHDLIGGSWLGAANTPWTAGPIRVKQGGRVEVLKSSRYRLWIFWRWFDVTITDWWNMMELWTTPGRRYIWNIAETTKPPPTSSKQTRKTVAREPCPLSQRTPA